MSWLLILAAALQAASFALQSIHKQISTKLYSFAVRYSGVFFIDTAGEYQFQINSPPGTRLTVNGNTVTFNQGSNSR